MAIVKMKRLTLLGMQSDKDKIYNALVKCNAVQLKRSEDIANCTVVAPSVALEKQLEKIRRVEEAMRFLAEQTDSFNAENKRNKDVPQAQIPKNSFARPLTEIDFDYFLSFGKNVERLEQSLDELARLKNRLGELETQKLQNRTEYERIALFKDLPHPTTWYQNTESTLVQLSQLPSSEWTNVQNLAQEFDLVSLDKVCENANTTVVAAVVHKSQTVFLEKAAAFGLIKCSFRCEVLPKFTLKELDASFAKLTKEIAQVKRDIVSFDSDVAEWKIYIDYLSLCAKKLEADGDLQNTTATFILEGYYPAEQESQVENAICSVGDCIITVFDEIGEEEFAPILTKNNKVVQQFENVTNMYTPPDYHEIDPNPVMSVFYFVIFGFMVADMGYGLVLMLAGLFAALVIKQKTGTKTLLQMFGICGLSAVAVGALFGSCFSYSLYEGLIPDPAQYPMVMMIISLMLGVVHIMAGVGCKMAVKIKQKHKAEAWLADFPWIIVFAAAILAIWNAALDMANYEQYQSLYLPQQVGSIALYVALGALAFALIFAGVGTKGFVGKVVKSFGSVYGIINYFSDIMSYIRVFGLMLSSALIGTVVRDLSAMVAGSGGIGYVFAALLLVLAHLFNLVMGLLSVYIHNGRLQYVEFFGKFYTGDGQLFVPFGSDTTYTLVTNSAK